MPHEVVSEQVRFFCWRLSPRDVNGILIARSLLFQNGTENISFYAETASLDGWANFCGNLFVEMCV